MTSLPLSRCQDGGSEQTERVRRETRSGATPASAVIDEAERVNGSGGGGGGGEPIEGQPMNPIRRKK